MIVDATNYKNNKYSEIGACCEKLQKLIIAI